MGNGEWAMVNSEGARVSGEWVNFTALGKILSFIFLL